MLPNTLKYQTKIESSAARSYRSNIQPQNGTGPYGVNQTIIINIPTRANLTMNAANSYLKFRLNLTNPSAAASVYARWDSSAHSIIQRCRVFHGSNLISDIDNYNFLAKMLFDAQMPADALLGKFSILSGTRNDMISLGTDSVLNVKGGRRIGSSQGSAFGIPATQTVSETYCINLISLVGTLCAEKYLPLFACTSAPLRVELQLVQNVTNAICSDIPLTLTLDNVEYVAEMIEISDSAVSIINQSLNGQPLQFTVPDYKNYQSTFNLPAGNSSVSIPIPAKFSSLKSILINQSDSSKYGTQAFFPLSSNVLNLSSYFFRVGPMVLPSKAPESITEFYSESVKAVANMASLTHQPSVDYDSYSQNLPVSNNDTTTGNGTVSSGAFMIGIDTENYPSSDKTSLFSGINTCTDDIYFNPQYSNLTAATNIRYTSFACFDTVLIFESGTCYVKF